jgi:hypothetical protein
LDHFSHNERLHEFKGIIGHHHVRRDKSDIHPGFDWNKLIDICRIEQV